MGRAAQQAGLALAAGIIASFALPPWHWWWLLPLGIGALIWLLDDVRATTPSPWRRAKVGAALFFLFAMGWFVPALLWIGEAFLVEAERFAALRPLAWLGLPAYLALYHAAAGAILALSWREDGWRMVQLAAAITLADMARGTFLSGFPWNLFAHVLPEGLLALMQPAALVGVHGVSFLVLLFAGALALAAMSSRQSSWRRNWAALLMTLIILLLSVAYGGWRLAQEASRKSDVWLIIVHTTIPQAEKWKPENRQRIFEDLLQRSRAALQHVRRQRPRAVAVIWPESAVPFLLEEDAQALAAIAGMLEPGEVLLTGALRRAELPPPGAQARGRLYNSVFGIDHEGRIALIYDKRKLVPFGETLPLAAVLEPLGLRKLVSLPSGFRPGRLDGPFVLPPLPPLAAFVCYEIIFPDLANRSAGARWLVNVSNDAWFGDSAGPWQHFQAARFRAIEQGAALVRATNAGLSALILPSGRIMAAIYGLNGQPLKAGDLERRLGVLMRALPLPDGGNLFPHAGNLPLGVAFFILLMLLGWRFRRSCA